MKFQKRCYNRAQKTVEIRLPFEVHTEKSNLEMKKISHIYKSASRNPFFCYNLLNEKQSHMDVISYKRQESNLFSWS